MLNMAEAFRAAIAHHQAGQLRAAETIYCQILEADPRQAEVVHLLGLVAHQLGQHDQAIELIRRAISLRGDQATYHFNLGSIYQARQQLDPAIACYREATRLDPRSVAAHLNLGAALKEHGRPKEAIASFQEVLKIQPDFAEAQFNLGSALFALEDWAAAAAAYREALRLKPDYVEAIVNLGDLMQRQDRLDESLELYDRAIQLRPDFATAYLGRGNIYKLKSKIQEATADFRSAIRLQPDYAEAYNNLGMLFQEQKQLDSALEYYRQALELNPASADVLVNIGTALQKQDNMDAAVDYHRRALAIDPNQYRAHFSLGAAAHFENRIDEALAYYGESIRLKPDYAEAYYNRSFIWLSRGDFTAGCKDYEWRFGCKDYQGRHVDGPPWDGSPLEGRTLLIHAEQGLGDTLQFIRYATLPELQSGNVYVEVQRTLMPLLAVSGFRNLIARDSPLPRFDVCEALMSMPGVCGTTLETIPTDVPYLAADPELVKTWRDQLRGFKELKVGIVWQGSTTFAVDYLRSIPLVQFAPLAEVEGVQLISLQKHEGIEQLAAFEGRFTIANFAGTLDAEAGAFMDTAAIMCNLDLVITSDTAAAHLAGGLGVNVWLALSSMPEWRWLHGRPDSPWYPTMRLFRQPSPGDWPAVFAQMKSELEKLAQNPRESSIARGGPAAGP